MVLGSIEEQEIRFLEAACGGIGRSIYTPVADLNATAWVTPEPVPFHHRMEGERMELSCGQRWGKLWDCAWFHFTGRVPPPAAGHPTVLLIDVSGEGCVVDSDGQPVLGLTTLSSEFDRQYGRPGKRVVPLLSEAVGGESVDLWVEAGCNDLFGGYRNEGTLAEASIATVCHETRVLYYDFSVLLDLARILPQGSARKSRITHALHEAAQALSCHSSGEVIAARKVLAPELGRHNGNPSLTISAVGQAHIDLAWLWPIRETLRKGARTFATVLALMDRYPDYVFGASQPQLYDWIKRCYPGLHGGVKARVQEGRWELQGAMWVEADVNLSGGESLVRQLLYGARFYRQEFGFTPKMCWLPDDFGFPGSLPQILRGAGIEYFLTTKLSWNRVNRFPRHSFWWEGIDGSRILAHMPPEDNYNSSALPHAVSAAEERYSDKDVSEHALLLFGIGDGGGGPGEEHLERLERERDLEGLSPVVQEPAIRFFEKLAGEASGFKTWSGDLYLERHQGTYTTQARNKRYNRKLELRLRELEWLATALSTCSDYRYPSEDLERIWKETLLYQFHDILPGTSITRVFDESLARYDVLLSEVEDMCEQATMQLTSQVAVPNSGRHVLVTNSLPWDRSEWFKIGDAWQWMESVPSMGYSVFSLDGQSSKASGLRAEDGLLENDKLRVELGPDGQLSSVFDKEHRREVLAGAGGNRFSLYHDNGDAWDFPHDYRERPASEPRLQACNSWIDGPRAVLRQRFGIGRSRIEQDIVLTAGSGRIDFATKVEWQEEHKMLRTSFPVAIQANMATYDIQFGSRSLATHSNTSWDEARDEVCAHKWVDLSQPDYGVALLNDCKYGHRLKGNVIDLNLLRSPTTPDPTADLGFHEFTYALFPHSGDYRQGGVTREAYQLNVPLRHSSVASDQAADGPSSHSFLRVDPDKAILETVKRAEDSDNIVVRLYEPHGASSHTRVHVGVELERVWQADLLENVIAEAPLQSNSFEIRLKPFEIQTFLLSVRGPSSPPQG